MDRESDVEFVPEGDAFSAVDEAADPDLLIANMDGADGYVAVERLRASAAGALALAEGDRLLAVGCGTGAAAIALLDAVGTSGEVRAVDANALMIAEATRRASDRPNIGFEVGAATALRGVIPGEPCPEPPRLPRSRTSRGVAHGIGTAIRAEGMSVDVAHDGSDGYLKATSGGYDVVILDIMLPSMNGYRVCAAMRAQGDWTPVLMLTAKGGEFDETEGLETGADDYLTKPFSMMVLVARVKALLRRPRMAGAAPYAVGDLRLDPVRHRCWRGTVEIDLSAREMDVLAHLVARAGQTVAKSQLLDNVWGDSFDGDPNIVEVYVGRLRRKIDVAFGCKSIETVRGVGYRIAATPTPAGR